VGAVVVAVDVGGDLLSCLVEGLELGAPDERCLSFPNSLSVKAGSRGRGSRGW
jgi:hypothetical protein